MPVSSTATRRAQRRPSPGSQVRVGLLIAAELTAAGVRSMLAPHPDRVVVLGAASGGRAQVEIVDVGYAMSTPTSMAACPRLALAWDDTPRSVYRAQELGASRLLPIDVGALDLVVAIEDLLADSPAPGAEALRNPLGPGAQPLLSPREAEILARICRGLSNDEIAKELFLSLNTVKTYIRSAYRKMQVTSRSQAVLWGLGRASSRDH